MSLFAKHQLVNTAHTGKVVVVGVISILCWEERSCREANHQKSRCFSQNSVKAALKRSAFYQFLVTSLYFSSYAGICIYLLICRSCREGLQCSFETKCRTSLAAATHLQQLIQPIALLSSGNSTLVVLHATLTPCADQSLTPPSAALVLLERPF